MVLSLLDSLTWNVTKNAEPIDCHIDPLSILLSSFLHAYIFKNLLLASH